MRSMIGPAYFQTLGIRVVAGREFDERDRAHAPEVVMVNEVLARKLFGAANPLGRRVTIFNGLVPNWTPTIVGVVADYHQSWKRSGTSLVYTPALQAKQAAEMTYYVRTRSDALPEPVIREIVKREVSSIAPYDISTMRNRMAEFASAERALAILLGAFAFLALAIAVIGIYGVVAYGSSLRTVEFGVRVSVGARPVDITRLVLREAILILGLGILLAVPATYFILAIVRHQSTAVSFDNPLIYGAAVILLAVCALVAAFLPAHRATRMSVSGALRHS
jgi:putative ABC transport system permease protein